MRGAAFCAVALVAAPALAQTTLNVRDADIRAFIADAAKVTGRTFIIDSRVQGKVTVVGADEAAVLSGTPASIEGRDEVAVRCTPRDRAADAATYRVAVAEGVLDRARLGAGLTWIATAVGVVLVIATWWTRPKSHQES